MSLLEFDFMRRALVAAILVGVTAPAIGIFLVQRGLSLLGDGIGHVTLAGVAAGLLMGVSPLPTAIVAAVVGAIAIEFLLARGRAAGDVALAALFYGGIAMAALLVGLSHRASGVNLVPYLFGSVATVSPSDLIVIAVMAVVVLAVVLFTRRQLFAATYDEEVARVAGLPVTVLHVLGTVTAALAVALATQVVGVLLISALMVLPVAATQQLTRSFRGTLAASVVVGVLVAVIGLTVAYYLDVAPGAAIVLLALGVFVVATATARVRTR